MSNVLVFAERMLPSTQTFIPLQVNELKRYTPTYVGLLPADRNYALTHPTILLSPGRSRTARVRRELYRWTGVAPSFHKKIEQTNPELLHVHFAEAASSALFLSKRLKIPFVLHLRGGAELFSDAELRGHLFQRPFLAFREELWKRASLFLCVSKYIRDKAELTGFPKEKLLVHYTGMNTGAFTPTVPISEKDPNRILYVGRLVTYKGCNYLIEAMHRLQQQRPEARLVIIGEGAFRSTLEELNRKLDVKAEFLGEQSQQTIRWWLERSRVFCGPSVTLDDGMSEAFGNVFSEAQSMGVPVVSFRHGGIPETMQEGVTGLLAPERDVAQLASHLQRFLEDEVFWSNAREVGMAWVRKNFDIHSQTARLEEIYDEVIANHQLSNPARTRPTV